MTEADKLLFYLYHGIKEPVVFQTYLAIIFQVPEYTIDTLRNWQNLYSGSLIHAVRAIMIGKLNFPFFIKSRSNTAFLGGLHQLVPP